MLLGALETINGGFPFYVTQERKLYLVVNILSLRKIISTLCVTLLQTES